MDQHTREFMLIAIVLGLTFVVYIFLRRSGGSPVQNASRVLAGVLGAFMLLGGTAKFSEPFTTMFSQQIALSQLPFPALSAFPGQAGDISSGLALLLFFSLGMKLAGGIRENIFYLTHLAIVVIMLVAVYVHLHPDVPAEVLPFQPKPTVVTIIVMLLVLLNMVLRRNGRFDAPAQLAGGVNNP